MPRSSSSPSRSSRSSSSSYTKPTVSKPIVTPATQTIEVKQQPQGFFSNMWQGFGLGTGQAIAHNMFRSDPVVKHEHINTTRNSATENKDYVQCMKDYNDDELYCKKYLEQK
jgi:hypothetical protein